MDVQGWRFEQGLGIYCNCRGLNNENRVLGPCFSKFMIRNPQDKLLAFLWASTITCSIRDANTKDSDPAPRALGCCNPLATQRGAKALKAKSKQALGLGFRV